MYNRCRLPKKEQLLKMTDRTTIPTAADEVLRHTP